MLSALRPPPSSLSPHTFEHDGEVLFDDLSDLRGGRRLQRELTLLLLRYVRSHEQDQGAALGNGGTQDCLIRERSDLVLRDRVQELNTTFIDGKICIYIMVGMGYNQWINFITKYCDNFGLFEIIITFVIYSCASLTWM